MSTRSRASRVAQPPADDFGILLTAALGVFKSQLHAHLARAGFDDLGPSFGFVFRSLADRPLSLVELAARLAITSQGALKIVAEMEERGYVERTDDVVDRRVRRLSLTGRGRAALREARRFHASVEHELVVAVGSRQVAGARAALTALAHKGVTDSTPLAALARPF